MSGIHNDLLSRLKIIFDHMAVKLREHDPLPGYPLHDKSLTAKQACSKPFVEENGKIYHHIIDPTTGYPAENGLKSVTIVSDDGTLADGLSTSLFIMGKDKACDFWKEHSDKFDMILMTDDNELYVSEGIADVFSSDLTTNIVKKLSEK